MYSTSQFFFRFATSVIYIVLKHVIRIITTDNSFATSIIYIVLKPDTYKYELQICFATSIIYIVLKQKVTN